MHAFIYIKPFASYPSNQSCMHPWPSFNVHASFFLAWTGSFCSSLWLLCTVQCFSQSTPRVNGFLWSVRRLFSATPRFVQEVGSANSCGSIRYLWIWRTISVGRSFSQLCVRQLLIPRVFDDPRSCQMEGHVISTHKGSWSSRYTCKKASGQDVRTHPPMVLLAMVRERYKSVGLLLGIRRLPGAPVLFVWRPIYTASGVLFLSLMVRRYFMLLWW